MRHRGWRAIDMTILTSAAALDDADASATAAIFGD